MNRALVVAGMAFLTLHTASSRADIAITSISRQISVNVSAGYSTGGFGQSDHVNRLGPPTGDWTDSVGTGVFAAGGAAALDSQVGANGIHARLSYSSSAGYIPTTAGTASSLVTSSIDVTFTVSSPLFMPVDYVWPRVLNQEYEHPLSTFYISGPEGTVGALGFRTYCEAISGFGFEGTYHRDLTLMPGSYRLHADLRACVISNVFPSNGSGSDTQFGEIWFGLVPSPGASAIATLGAAAALRRRRR